MSRHKNLASAVRALGHELAELEIYHSFGKKFYDLRRQHSVALAKLNRLNKVVS